MAKKGPRPARGHHRVNLFNKLYCFFVYMKNMFIRVGCHEDDMLMKNKTPDSVISDTNTVNKFHTETITNNLLF